MIDPARFAELLCGYCLDVQPGEQVLVRSTTAAEPLLLALQRSILAREAWPSLHVALPGQAPAFYSGAREKQLDGAGSAAIAELEQVDCTLGIQAPHTRNELAGVDPALIARHVRGRAVMRKLQMQKRWCGTLWPTEATAEQAGMTLDGFSEFVARALMLDRDEPETGWRELARRQATLIEQLTPAQELRIEADGTDLALRVDGRTWINSDGKRNMPSGEVFTGPIEDSANGHIRFSVPSSPAGVEVSGARLTLKDGVVVDARAEIGQEYLDRALETDAGARRLGEIGIGTNHAIDRPVGVILFDEKIGGTVHLALGSSYPETGGTNESALHWDLICDLRSGGRLTVDGEPLDLTGPS